MATSPLLWRLVALAQGYVHPEDSSVYEALEHYFYDPDNTSVTAYFSDVRDFAALCRKQWLLDAHWGMHRGRDALQPGVSGHRAELHPGMRHYRPSGSNEDVRALLWLV